MSKKDQAHAHRWQSRVHNWLIMPQTGNTQKLRPVTMDELAKHKVSSSSTNKEMWMAVNGMVYDVTRFTQFHPGGVLLMQKYSGMDATAVYDKNHTNVPPEDVIGNYRIGPLIPNESVPSAAAPVAEKPQRSTVKSSSTSKQQALADSPQPSSSTKGQSSQGLQPPPSQIAQSSSSSLAPPPPSANKAINPSTLRYPPLGSSGLAPPPPPYERLPNKNPSASAGLSEPLDAVVSAARNSRLFDAVPDDQLAAAAVASRNKKRAKRDSRDPATAHGAVRGMPSNDVIEEDEADDIASIECVFDLLDAEGKGSVRIDQLEAFLVNIGGFPDAKSAREAVKDTLSGMPSIKSTGRITKAQFVEIASSL